MERLDFDLVDPGPMPVNLRFLETFVWIARLGSFSKTAERLNSTLSAVSARIQALESELGVRLLERQGRSIRLTQQGRDALPIAERLLQLEGDLESTIRGTDAFSGRVRLGIIDTAANAVLSAFLRTIQVRHPKIELDLQADTSHNLIQRLALGSIDLAVSLVGQTTPGAVHRRLFQMACHWVASPQLISDNRTMTLAGLAQYPILTFSQGSTPHAHTEALFAPHGGPRRMYCGTSLSTVIRLAKDGLGVAIIPAVLVQEDLRAGNLRMIPVDAAFPPLELQVSYLSDPQNRLQRLLSELLIEVGAQFCQESSPELVWQDRSGF
jgi:DNA-binding transcriptional LysR family regulator